MSATSYPTMSTTVAAKRSTGDAPNRADRKVRTVPGASGSLATSASMRETASRIPTAPSTTPGRNAAENLEATPDD